MDKITTELKRFIQDEQGASAVEHGVMATLIVLACALAVSAMGIELAGAMGSAGRL